MKVMQCLEARDNGREGNRDLGITRVGDVLLTVYLEGMNLRVECVLDLRGVAAETDRHAIFGDFRNGESVIAEP